MDALTEDDIWGAHHEEHLKYGLPDGSGSPKHVTLIDGDFFDNHIVSRWTSEWLAGDTTWVIATARNEPWT